MVIFLVVLVILIVLIIILLQIKLTIGFNFKMDMLACSAFVTIYLFGKIPAKKIMIFPPEQNKNKKKKPKKIRSKMDFEQLKMGFWGITKLFYRSVMLKEFRLHVKEGTGDACQTALLYGLLWNLAGLIPGRLFNNFSVGSKEIKIETDFKEKVWKVNFDCIFSLKIVNIISIVREIIKIYLKNRKGGDAGVRSSDRRSNDYSHAKY